MLELVDDALEAFLRASVPLAAQDVDVSFEAPERTWSAKLSRPTVNLFLWNIRRSPERTRTGVEEVEQDGRLVRRMALPRVELRYLVTAWTNDHGDERVLLAGLMRSILATGEVPATFVPAGLRELPPLVMTMGHAGEDHLDVFQALEGQLKPGLSLDIVTAVDTHMVTPAGPPVTSLETRLSRIGGHGDDPRPIRRVAGEVADPAAIGAPVIGPGGGATVNEAGRFVIRARTGDELTLQTDPPRTVVVSAEGGVRID